jgi:hypothetical protein
VAHIPSEPLVLIAKKWKPGDNDVGILAVKFITPPLAPIDSEVPFPAPGSASRKYSAAAMFAASAVFAEI